jgi:protein-L-isoaspartate(D-aspartate) O-methyltransferase
MDPPRTPKIWLAAGHRVLEIGTGTGYNAALIARIVGDQKSVVTIDVVPDLIGQARVNLTAAGYGRVTVVCGDGAAGVPDHAPYDRIIVTTGTWDLATQWWAQLGPAGRIVLPLSIRGIQLSVGLEMPGSPGEQVGLPVQLHQNGRRHHRSRVAPGARSSARSPRSGR